MALTLPLRRASAVQVGIEQTRVVRKTVRRHGKRRSVTRTVTDVRPAAEVGLGHPVELVGRMVDRDGNGIAGAELHILSRTVINPEQLVAAVRTDGDGRFRYTRPATMSGYLRVAFPGSPQILPSSGEARLDVPAETSIRVDRRALLNGQAVTFRGRLLTLPVPPGNKLVEMQVALSGRWQTFRTLRTDAVGRWSTRYRFKRTQGTVIYKFRAKLPQEAAYPFLDGASRPVQVRVRGRR